MTAPGTSVSRNSRGLTLIEVMVSLAILFAVFFGLLETATVVAQFNMRSAIRAEGIAIADETIGQLRALPYANLPTAAEAPYTVARKVRQMTLNFTVQVQGGGNTQTTRTITVTVSPPAGWRGVRSARFMTVIRNPM